MWWTREKTDGRNNGHRCPHCVTHPRLVKSGLGDKKSLKCPVCKVLFDGNGVKFDPNTPQKEVSRKTSVEEEFMREQEELWDHLWGN